MSLEIHDKAPKTYILLGAPHSATSFIAKLLHESGVEMHPMNENYEDLDFETLNRRILKGMKYKDKMQRLIKEKKGKMWGWKDPKTSRTLDKYLPYLDGDVYLICCFRKPRRLIQSWINTKHTSGRHATLSKFNNKLIINIRKFLNEWR